MKLSEWKTVHAQHKETAAALTPAWNSDPAHHSVPLSPVVKKNERRKQPGRKQGENKKNPGSRLSALATARRSNSVRSADQQRQRGARRQKPTPTGIWQTSQQRERRRDRRRQLAKGIPCSPPPLEHDAQFIPKSRQERSPFDHDRGELSPSDMDRIVQELAAENGSFGPENVDIGLCVAHKSSPEPEARRRSRSADVSGTLGWKASDQAIDAATDRLAGFLARTTMEASLDHGLSLAGTAAPPPTPPPPPNPQS